MLFRSFISDAIVNGGVENLPAMIDLVHATGALSYTADAANSARCQALECLKSVEPSLHREAMCNLINFVVDRQH